MPLSLSLPKIPVYLEASFPIEIEAPKNSCRQREGPSGLDQEENGENQLSARAEEGGGAPSKRNTSIGRRGDKLLLRSSEWILCEIPPTVLGEVACASIVPSLVSWGAIGSRAPTISFCGPKLG